jgi:hypothetical protein
MLLAASGVAGAGLVPKLKTIPLAGIPSELSVLDREGVLGGVRVYVCEREPYGTFFLETAIVEGTMVLADSLTSQFGRALAAASRGAVDVAQTDPGEWPEAVEGVVKDPGTEPAALANLRDLAERLQALTGPLVRTIERAPGLAARIPGLIHSAPEVFTGITGKVKVVRVVGALGGSAGQLKNAAARSGHALQNAQAIVAAMQP